MNINLLSRFLIAITIGIAGGVLCYDRLYDRGVFAADFTWAWYGARVLLTGGNPYEHLPIRETYPLDAPLYYPIYAPMVALPFSPFTPEVAGALFFGVSSGILAWVLIRKDISYLSLFLSSSYLMSAENCQWTPLITAGLVLPLLSFVLLAKPNVGILALITNLSRTTIIVCLTVAIIGSILWPWWLQDWLFVVTVHGQATHKIPIMIAPLLLLGLTEWRNDKGRLFLLLAILPQSLIFYDQLPLWLVTRTARQRYILTGLSWIGFIGWLFVEGPRAFRAAGWVVWWMYVPVLVMLWYSRHSCHSKQSGC